MYEYKVKTNVISDFSVYIIHEKTYPDINI